MRRVADRQHLAKAVFVTVQGVAPDSQGCRSHQANGWKGGSDAYRCTITWQQRRLGSVPIEPIGQGPCALRSYELGLDAGLVCWIEPRQTGKLPTVRCTTPRTRARRDLIALEAVDDCINLSIPSFRQRIGRASATRAVGTDQYDGAVRGQCLCGKPIGHLSHKVDVGYELAFASFLNIGAVC